jgi:outer membrane protein TolC
MKLGMKAVRWGSVGLTSLVVLAAASALHAQQPLPPAPPPPGPAAAASSSAPGFEAKIPPAALADQRFLAALQPRMGGLKVEDLARKSEMTSPEVLSKIKAVEGAAAKVDQAAVNFAPRVTLQARYTRLSTITYPSFGNIAGGPQAGPITAQCGAAVGLPADQCVVNNAQLVPFAFSTPPVNMYSLTAGVVIPISDYILRISQNYSAAARSHSAAQINERATRAKVQRDARVAYYNWVRARGGLVVSEQGLATAQAHLKDVGVAVQVGSASKADFMRVESQVASTELLVERTRNLTNLVEEQLRVMMHDPPGNHYEIGDDTISVVAPVTATNVADLQTEALEKRLEVRALDDTVYSLRETKKVVQAGYLPRVDAFGDVQYQNPNTRVFPQSAEWKATWDLGVQMSWTINDTFSSRGQVAELEAKAQEIEAQKNQLRDGIKLEVMAAYNASREAQVALETTAHQLAAAEESYRVRRELFRAGRATSVELTDAETDLMRSRLDALNARLDARVARANLDHALGRDVPAGR